MGQVSYSDDAIADLIAIRQFITAHNPSAANRVAARLIQSVERLKTHPKFGKPGRVEDTRELNIPKFPYTIVYEEAGSHCRILRILHQAMQWP